MTDSQQPGLRAPSGDSAARYFYPNRMGRILLLALEDVLGHNGLHALLKMAGYEHFIRNLPPNTSDRQFPFEAVSGFIGTLHDMYGPRGARGVALRVGRVCFKYGLREYGPMMGVADLTFQLLPLSIKLEQGARAFSDLFNDHSDQVVQVQDTPETLYWRIERCPMCWKRRSEHPHCYLAVGLLQESLLWLSGGKTFQVEVKNCIAQGDDVGTITIAKKPLD